jgi:hypothetical protein
MYQGAGQNTEQKGQPTEASARHNRRLPLVLVLLLLLLLLLLLPHDQVLELLHPLRLRGGASNAISQRHEQQ